MISFGVGGTIVAAKKAPKEQLGPWPISKPKVSSVKLYNQIVIDRIAVKDYKKKLKTMFLSGKSPWQIAQEEDLDPEIVISLLSPLYGRY